MLVYCGLMTEIRLLIHDIRSTHNVGSLFRTADAAGVSRIYISGYSPTPIDRFGRKVKELSKVALDAEEVVPWEQVGDVFALISTLKQGGWKIVGVEQDERSIDYRNFTGEGRILVVMGTEVGGMTGELRAACDTLLEIPMHGMKDSLNVSVAAGIVLFSLRRED